MKKIGTHSTIFFILLILKPWKAFHDMLLYYFICFKTRVKRYPSVNKKELIFRYARIADSKIIFRHLFFLFRTPEYKEDKDLLITLFNNAPELVINLFEKDDLTKEDTDKLISDYFDSDHNKPQNINNIEFKVNNNYQTNYQFIKLNETHNNIQNNINLNIFKSVITSSKNSEENIKKETANPYLTENEKKLILFNSKNWSQKYKDIYDKKTFILLGGILFHLQIIKTEGKDNRKNRLKTWESIIDCTLYDDSLIKNLLYYEDSSEKLNLLKHYDRIKTFFAEIDFKAGIICINEIEQKLDKKK